MNHMLKIAPAYFQAVRDGRKTFEIRKNDRHFEEGDGVTLREYDGGYTGRLHAATIGYVTAYEQQPGYVVFSLLLAKEPT